MTRANMLPSFLFITSRAEKSQLGLFAALVEPTLLHCFLQPPPSLFCPRTGAHAAMELAAAATAVSGGLAGFPSRTRESTTGLPAAVCSRRSFGTRRRSVPAASIALARSSEPRPYRVRHEFLGDGACGVVRAFFMRVLLDHDRTSRRAFVRRSQLIRIRWQAGLR